MKKNEQTLQEQFEALQLRNKIRFGRKLSHSSKVAGGSKRTESPYGCTRGARLRDNHIHGRNY